MCEKLQPDFEKEIVELLGQSEEEIRAFEIDITKEELIERYRKNKREKEAFFNWVTNNQNEIYCIRGDAGTGKTTFLHYLEYTYRDTEIEWDIIDMTKSTDSVKILNNKLQIPRTEKNVFYKSISILIRKIAEDLFRKSDGGKYDIEKTFESIETIINRYQEIYDGYYPIKFVDNFFGGFLSLDKNNGDKREFVEKSADFVVDYLNQYLSQFKRDIDAPLANILELYIYYMSCRKKDKRNILAFDNLEKFIGTDEIYDKQLVDFVSKIRHIQKDISSNNEYIASKFQVTIFMRNTSTRMFNPQQIAEIFPHIVDLSEWFQSAKIIQKKIEWYEENGIHVDEAERLIDVINDVGYGKDNKFRGLRSKLNMLFNNDKRVIVNILTNVFENASNAYYLQVYDFFRENSDKEIARFAKRVIIFRLILNELRKDGFFVNIVAERAENEKTSLGYARKILTILYDHKLILEDGYMKFDDIIPKLDSRERNAIERYFARYESKKRNEISKVLFCMNYYDGRKDNWLQFIDIQYNIPQKKTCIKNYMELDELIEQNHEDINIRITNAGIAYLFFVVYSFEYFSCKSSSVAPQDCKAEEMSIPPLLCIIPKKEEIMTKDVGDLLCVKVIEYVSEEAVNCIKKMVEDRKNGVKTIPFKKNLHDEYIEHSNRIINSHVGFINNYIQCIKEIYGDELKNNTEFLEKYQNIEERLGKIKGRYFEWE